eukprot:scaffold330521_cov43-Attheya_sp.AAC.1
MGGIVGVLVGGLVGASLGQLSHCRHAFAVVGCRHCAGCSERKLVWLAMQSSRYPTVALLLLRSLQSLRSAVAVVAMDLRYHLCVENVFVLSEYTLT